MTRDDSSPHSTFPFWVSSLQGGLHGFCGTWLRCSQRLGMEWRPEASHEGPREAGIGQRRGCRDRVPRAWGARIPLRGRTFLRKALLRPARSHSALLRLALHPKNRTLHPVQLPDLG